LEWITDVFAKEIGAEGFKRVRSPLDRKHALPAGLAKAQRQSAAAGEQVYEGPSRGVSFEVHWFQRLGRPLPISHLYAPHVSHTAFRESLRIFLTSPPSLRSTLAWLDNEHSQTVITRQPRRLSALAFLVSRFLLLSNFWLQKSLRVPGILPRWQKWQCQKQPWTKTAT
jgi:hypothetical protein